MAINGFTTSEYNLLNAQKYRPKVVIVSAASASKGAVIFSTTYIVETTGAVYMKIYETGTDVANGDGSVSISVSSDFNASDSYSTTNSTTAFSGAAGMVSAIIVADPVYPKNAIVKISVEASVSTTSAVDMYLELDERQSGIKA